MSQRPQKHGVFYPRGYVVVTFESSTRAEQARRLLVDGGYDEQDAELMDTERVRRGTSEDLEHLGPVMKALGSEGDLIRDHQSLAEKGASFLLAYAPTELDTERLMNVAKRVGYSTAHKYDRFTITKL